MPKQERKSTSVRLTLDAVRLVEALSAKLGVNQSSVVELAIRHLAKSERVSSRTASEGASDGT